MPHILRKCRVTIADWLAWLADRIRPADEPASSLATAGASPEAALRATDHDALASSQASTPCVATSAARPQRQGRRLGLALTAALLLGSAGAVALHLTHTADAVGRGMERAAVAVMPEAPSFLGENWGVPILEAAEKTAAIEDIHRTLDEAGLLASPSHERGRAGKFLRWAGNACSGLYWFLEACQRMPIAETLGSWLTAFVSSAPSFVTIMSFLSAAGTALLAGQILLMAWRWV
jgi:hypothetical protein